MREVKRPRLAEAKKTGSKERARIEIDEKIDSSVCDATNADADMQSANLWLIRWTRSMGSG